MWLKSPTQIVDLGPEGGSAGGEIIAQGTPEEVAKNPRSYTGQFLKKSPLNPTIVKDQVREKTTIAESRARLF